MKFPILLFLKSEVWLSFIPISALNQREEGIFSKSHIHTP